MKNRLMRALPRLMLSASVWAIKHKEELHKTLVSDVCKFLRSALEVIIEFSNGWYLDGEDDLRVLVVKYAPNVVCSPHQYSRDATILRACQSIVNQMKASKDFEIFAQRSIYDPKLETALPVEYISPAKGSTDLLRFTTQVS